MNYRPVGLGRSMFKFGPVRKLSSGIVYLSRPRRCCSSMLYSGRSGFGLLIDLRGPLKSLQPARADEATAAMVANGRMLPAIAFDSAAVGGSVNASRANERLPGAGVPRWGVVGPDGELIAVYERAADGLAKASIVIPSRSA